MAPPEIYESMSRGTIDGSLFPYVSVESYKLTPLIKYATFKANFGSIVAAYSISEKKWNTLSADTKEILLKAGDEATKAACINFDKQEAEAKARLAKSGVQFVEFDEAAQKVLQATYIEIADNWAQQLDARNRPGSEALKAFRDASAKALSK
ncbi:TRAP transporter substrate-binding protein DctP [Alcaligenaceae bacterium CGII-47]|nr:TRAP transporter substrate-binding protein DctP [Alcaligenaceae bacterium CGII-47]